MNTVKSKLYFVILVFTSFLAVACTEDHEPSFDYPKTYVTPDSLIIE
jgi:hypothetical protein